MRNVRSHSMDEQIKCNSSSLDPMCFEEASGPLAVIVLPSLLTLSTVLVVGLILYRLFGNRTIQQRMSSPGQYNNGHQSVCLNAVSRISPEVEESLRPWEMSGEVVLEGLEFWLKGCYGPICKGLLKRDGTATAVVVKSLRGGFKHPEAEEFVQWVLLHKACMHDNLVRMLCCQTRRLPMFLVLEACHPGNLLHLLWTLRDRELGSGNLTEEFSERSVFLVAKQVAAGLDYLMSEHRLLHGDVAARNILIGPGLSARVSGLGVAFAARQNGRHQWRRAVDVPLKWQAPERIMKQPVTDRSDIWSFGILLYELITLGSPPYPELDPVSVLSQLQQSYRMTKPPQCGGPLYDLIKYCWMWSFKDRPTFSVIIKLLESYLYLADTKALHNSEAIDISKYYKAAGIK